MTVQLPADGHILFFRRDRTLFGFLSHFHPAPIQLDGQRWASVEYWYQTQKSYDLDYRAAIRACATPVEAKRLATRPSPLRDSGKSWFAVHGKEPRADWYDVKRDLMRRGDMAKYRQHPELAALLLATVDAEIVEDSPHDAHWGTGPAGTGENWAGRILMEVRAALRSVPTDDCS